MNAPSKRHGVSHTAAEAFFGLGRGCTMARRATLQHLRVLNNSSATAGSGGSGGSGGGGGGPLLRTVACSSPFPEEAWRDAALTLTLTEPLTPTLTEALTEALTLTLTLTLNPDPNP